MTLNHISNIVDSFLCEYKLGVCSYISYVPSQWLYNDTQFCFHMKPNNECASHACYFFHCSLLTLVCPLKKVKIFNRQKNFLIQSNKGILKPTTNHSFQICRKLRISYITITNFLKKKKIIIKIFKENLTKKLYLYKKISF
ncbi:hypothetical protein AAZV13_09G145700 [Glycine max]